MSPKVSGGVKAKPIAVETAPYNAETPPDALHRSITPNGSFYVRNHFSVPVIDQKTWTLTVSGTVKNPLILSLKEIISMREKIIHVTLECAGNGRTRMQPVPPSTPWRDGALGTAAWTGTQLREVLQKAQPLDNAVEVLFRGADAGVEAGRNLSFERSIPFQDALSEDPILAYEMNGKPIPKIHGFPVRLIVPGWYGMASVKWLTEIHVLSERFQGYYQKDRYVYTDAKNMKDSVVTRIRVKSLILEPNEDAVLKAGRSYTVTGLAWSGSGQIANVEFKTHSSEWKTTQLSDEDLGAYAWRRWSITWTPERPGRYVLMSRASDDSGTEQPTDPVWNLYGYGYNTVTTRNVQVV